MGRDVINGITGPDLRRARQAQGVSLGQIAMRIGRSKGHLSKIERGVEDRDISPALIRDYQRALGTPITVDGPGVTDPMRQGREVDPMRRRTFINDVGMAGLGLVASGLALETARHGLDLALAKERSRVTVDEWHEIVWEHGYQYLVASPKEFIEVLSVDMASIRQAFSADHDARTREELRGAGAMLAVFCAMTLANLGDIRHARRWWRTARRLADQSNNPATILWVRGREIVRALYEQVPLSAILDLVRQAEPVVAIAPATAQTEFMTGKAQALAVAGSADEAQETLHQAQDLYERLPTEVTADSGSLLGWPKERILFTKSYVYSFLGDYAPASEAQEAAVRAYPVSYRRGPAQIELQRALCLVRSGDVTDGLHHARQVLDGHPASDRIRPILDLARRVHDVVPAEQRQHAAVAEYRRFLDLANHSAA